MLEPRSPDNPAEWLNRAKSSLALARQWSSGIYPEDLCFQAQQAAEKAIKAVFVAHHQVFPYSHDLLQLMAMLEKTGITIPQDIKATGKLTLYATMTRYPGLGGPISEEEYKEALTLAERMVTWAEINTRS